MAIISSFTYCINAQRIQDDAGGELINALGVVSVFMPEFMPGMFSFSIVFSLREIDIFADNTIQVIFIDKLTDSTLADSGIIALPSAPEREEDGLPTSYQSLNMCMDFRNVILEHDGAYATIIYFNGQQIGDAQDIYVKGKRSLAS